MSKAAQPIRAIVGLGNPGAQYEQTLHNAGFWFVDRLARRYGGQFRAEGKFFGEACKVQIAGQDVWLLKPTTFMNRSGRAISALLNFYKIGMAELLVVHDEIDLPPGDTRLKVGGGHGGHNGLRDTIPAVGKDFVRLRVGVGHPGHKDRVADYVLGRASKADQDAIDASLDRAEAVIEDVVAGDLAVAMNRLHSAR
jgi:PTH1 family peptidyl-tRNA hydrolase